MGQRIFKSKDCGGRPLDLVQVGSFTSHIAGAEFRFVVTRCVWHSHNFNVTFRATGAVVTHIASHHLAAALGNYASAGKWALADLIQSRGAAFVASRLVAATKQAGATLAAGDAAA